MAVSRSRAARAARRRKRRLSLVVNDLSAAQWAALRTLWGGCAYCGSTGVPLQRDCVLPVSRGGRYTVSNVVPACRSCNTSKWNDEVTGWLRHKGLDEGAFLLRHLEVVRLLTEVTSDGLPQPSTDLPGAVQPGGDNVAPIR